MNTRRIAEYVPLLPAWGGSDLIYGSQGRIRRIYLVESLAELGLIDMWLLHLTNWRGRGASMLQLPLEDGSSDRL